MERVSVRGVECRYDASDPAGYRAGMARLGARLGAQRTGATVYELAPGEAVCPYHYELGDEEWLLVVSGTPTVRTPEGSAVLEPDHLVFFAAGAAGAHQVSNESGEPARVLMWSNVSWPAASVYPDSDKVGVFMNDPGVDGLFRRSSAVEYYDGEVPRTA
jgi:uncharacterized cupin superfamily protein